MGRVVWCGRVVVLIEKWRYFGKVTFLKIHRDGGSFFEICWTFEKLNLDVFLGSLCRRVRLRRSARRGFVFDGKSKL